MASTLFDSNNSSTANLASGATFTGTRTSALGVLSIAAILFCDQVCTVLVDQSGDNVNYDVTDSYVYIPGQSFGINTLMVGKSYRIRVTNNGSVTTTTLRLEVFRQDSSQSLPRTLDQYGNLKMGLYELSDQFGFSGQFDFRRQHSVAIPQSLVGSTFLSADANFWTLSNTGTGSGANIGTTTTGVATLTSGTSNSGNGQIISVRTAQFIVGSPHRYLGFIRLTATAVANTTRSWGAMTVSAAATPADGFYFSVNGTGVLSVNSVKGGSVTSVASGSFNGTASQLATDTNTHVYEILYGEGQAVFIVDNVLIHTMSLTGTSTPTLANTLQLQDCAFSANSASGTSSAVLQVSGTSIFRYGPANDGPISQYFTTSTAATVLKVGPGKVHRLLYSPSDTSVTATLWDNTAASGTTLWHAVLINSTGGGSVAYSALSLDFGDMPFYTGLTLVLSANPTNGLTIVYE